MDDAEVLTGGLVGPQIPISQCLNIWESEGKGCVFPLVPPNRAPGPARWLLRATAYLSFLLSPPFLTLLCFLSYDTH